MPLWGCYTCALLCKGYHCPHLAKKQGEGPEYSDTAHITTLFPPPFPQNKANPLLIWNYCKMRDSNWFSICSNQERSQPQKERRFISTASQSQNICSHDKMKQNRKYVKHISGLRKARMGERKGRKGREKYSFLQKRQRENKKLPILEQ